MKKIHRLPTILGLLILILGVGAGVLLVHQGPTWFLRAGPEITPQQVKITNITDNSFTVSWITSAKTSGFVKYGNSSELTMTAADDRDQLSGQTGTLFTHHITLKNLRPSTTYYFKIGSGGKLFDNNGEPYQLTTAPTIQVPLPPNDVAYGTIVEQNGQPARDAIVYLSLANTTPLSTLTKSSGNWVIPLNVARSLDLSSYATYDQEASIEEIFVQGGEKGTATAVATTKYDSPLPTITLGQSFDFRKTKTAAGAEETSLVPTPSPAPTIGSQPSRFSLQEIATPSAATSSGELTIINPEAGEEVSTPRPEIIGTGSPGATLTITLHSPATYSGTTQIDPQGKWRWTPPSNLEPGEHTVTVSYVDEEGKEQKVSRRFTVLAAGGSQLPALTATPSGIATSSPTPTASPSPLPRRAIPSTEGGVPTSGFLTPTFFVFIMGVITIFLGSLINILSRKAI